MEKIFTVMLGNHLIEKSKVVEEKDTVVIVSDWDLFMYDLYHNYSKEDRETILKYVKEIKNVSVK